MKIKYIVAVLFLSFILVSCIPATQIIPTETAVPTSTPTASKTPQPTKTYTPKPTATEAMTVEEMAFLEQGFDKKGSPESGIFYGILHEDSLNLMPDGGIRVEADGAMGYVLSTMEITYYDPATRSFKRGRIATDWSFESPSDDGSYMTYYAGAGCCQGDPIVIPKRLVKNARDQYSNMTPGEKPFIKIMINYNFISFDPVNDLFNKLFPEFDGTIKSIDIPSLGEILTVRAYLPQGFPGWED